MHMELMTLRIGSNSIVANNNLDHALGYKAESHESVTVGLDLSYIGLLDLVHGWLLQFRKFHLFKDRSSSILKKVYLGSIYQG